jgi:hypothetical protein
MEVVTDQSGANVTVDPVTNAADQSGAVDPSDAAVPSVAPEASDAPSTEEASGAVVPSDAPSTEEASGAAVPCPANSAFNQLAKMRIGNKNVDELRKSPSKEIMDDALLLGKTPDEIIDIYVNCIAQNPLGEPPPPPPLEPSAPPVEAVEGGRKRSRKHRNRRGSRSKSKRSRRNSRSKSKRSRRNSRSKRGGGHKGKKPAPEYFGEELNVLTTEGKTNPDDIRNIRNIMNGFARDHLVRWDGQ